jgi:hypothetical protein
LAYQIAALEDRPEHGVAEDTSGAEAWMTQVQELSDMRRLVAAGGAQVFGFACVCSPDALTHFEEQELAGRSVEIRAAESDGAYEQPVRPVDPLRDATIAAGGEL